VTCYLTKPHNFIIPNASAPIVNCNR